MQFGVMPSSSGPLAMKLYRQEAEKRKRIARETRLREAEEAVKAEALRCQEAAHRDVMKRETRRRMFLARWTKLMDPPSTADPMSGRDIIRLVAESHGLHLRDLTSRHRGSNALSEIRSEAMYLVVKNTMLSYPQIGELFNRDHSTVFKNIVRYAARNNLPPARVIQEYGGEA